MAPQRFGRYEVQGEVGHGAMARVYRAWDPAFERTVAVKTVKSEHLSGDSAEAYLKRFRREARAVGALSHPAVVRVFDVGDDYIVMEFVDGQTLRQLLAEKRLFTPEEVIRLLAPLAEALDHAHRAGIIHRDVKPANVMVQPDGTPKLMDFGVAHLDMSLMTSAGEILGSPSYMAPEQISGEEVTPSWDIWALATVAYELLTGRAPFQGSITQVIYKVLHEESQPPRQCNAALPPWYDDVFARALGKSMVSRYPTAVELIAALDLRRFEQALTQIVPAPEAAQAPVEPESPAPPRAAAAPRYWLRGLGIGVSCGLLLGLTLCLGERGFVGDVASRAAWRHLSGEAAARADTDSASGIWATAVAASKPPRAPGAAAFVELRRPAIGVSLQAAGVEPTPSPRTP